MAVIGALLSVLSLAGWLVPVGVAEAEDAVLVQIIDTSLFVPPSPDSAGIAYLNFSDSLLVSDSEVNEIPALFTGDNVFDLTTAGILLSTSTTTTFSGEPTGVAFNTTNGHLFMATRGEGKGEVLELALSPPGE